MRGPQPLPHQKKKSYKAPGFAILREGKLSNQGCCVKCLQDKSELLTELWQKLKKQTKFYTLTEENSLTQKYYKAEENC